MWKVLNGPHEKDGLPVDTDWWENAFVSAFSRDGQRLAIGTEEGIVLVADIREVKQHMDGLKQAPGAK